METHKTFTDIDSGPGDSFIYCGFLYFLVISKFCTMTSHFLTSKGNKSKRTNSSLYREHPSHSSSQPPTEVTGQQAGLWSPQPPSLSSTE